MNLAKVISTSSLTLFTLLSSSFAELQVNIIKQSEWDKGFCADVQIYNPDDTKVKWEIKFNAGGKIYNLWNANYTQDPNSLEVVATGVDWNAYVEPNGVVTFGYCAKKVPNSTTQDNGVATEGDLTVIQETTSDWGTGFCKKVKVINNSSYDVDWNIKFQTDGVIYNLWNANYTQDPETLEVSANGVNWNNIVKANSQVEFGYCANRVSNTENSTDADNNTTTTTDDNSSNTGDNNTTSSDNNTTTNNDTTNDTSNDTNTTTNTTTYTYSGTFDSNTYKQALPLALKFYEAQRAAGPFPNVYWRKPAALDDGKDVGRDLSGGWFDAGDHVKFNLPMSYSATMLAWGMIEFKNGYIEAGALDYGKEQVKYALDYFLQAYNEGANPDIASDDIVYYQVGDPGLDHAFWGPPELMTMPRPTYSCDAQNRCSEVSAGMAAALAAGSILFKDDDPAYSAKLLDKAIKIYRFAEEYQGNNGYTAANGYYTSYSGYMDELAWGAVWLYKATGDVNYLNKAKQYIEKAQSAIYWAHNWDNVSIGTYVLLYEITGDQAYKSKIEEHLNYWINSVPKTPGGLAFLNQWGSLRYASTTAFIALAYSKYLPAGEPRDSYIAFAKRQMDYILGDNPRNSSYVVGFGNNYPINPHHRASHNSQTNNIYDPVNNEFLLEGALVGGPKSADDFDYKDDRTDYIANEVATDYNAGFTSALAGLIELTK